MSTKTAEEKDNAKSQAKLQLQSIVDMVEKIKAMHTGDGEELVESEAYLAIQQDPLSVQVRSNWHNPGEASNDCEFEILLFTGGPACRIIGQLSEHCEPEDARIEYQDWFTPWEQLHGLTLEEESALLTYAQQFYIGE